MGTWYVVDKIDVVTRKCCCCGFVRVPYLYISTQARAGLMNSYYYQWRCFISRWTNGVFLLSVIFNLSTPWTPVALVLNNNNNCKLSSIVLFFFVGRLWPCTILLGFVLFQITPFQFRFGGHNNIFVCWYEISKLHIIVSPSIWLEQFPTHYLKLT